MRRPPQLLSCSLVLLLAAACSNETTAPSTNDSHSSVDATGRGDGGLGPVEGGLRHDGSGPGQGDGGSTPTGDGGLVSKGDRGANGADGSPTGCTNRCSPGAKQCAATNSGWQACALQADGCSDWAAVTPCASGEVCSGGVCMKNCINQCTAGARICSGSGYLICAVAASGCTDWSSPSACDPGKVCSGGACVETCNNQCTIGSHQCAGSGVQSCELNASSGCTEWGNPVPCTKGQICSGGACVGNCSDQCAEGTSRCSGTQLQTCKRMASSCTDWDTPQPCSTGACYNGSCATGVCQQGDRRCSGTTVEACDSGGFWVVVQSCPQACEGGGCTNQVLCSGAARRCNGVVVEECNATGSAWLYLDACPHSCKDGLCEGGCEANALRCNGTKSERCNASGSGWELAADCKATFCHQGNCAEKELKLDGQTLILDGEHVYAGEVILKGSSRIDVGAKGWLRIRAANISVDATSSIIAPALGDDPYGRGRQNSCRYSGCTNAVFGYSGGGYGSAGTTINGSVQNCYYNGYARSCTLFTTGGNNNGAGLAEIHPGSRGGGCSSPNGGGMIDLIAQNKLELAGTLRADGADATSDCAAGSGGGIRLVADDLQVSGLLSAKGGAGVTLATAGGLGRIKFLYGAKEAINATLTGSEERSVIPPLDVRSSTHPDPLKVYNDDFSAFNVSWTRPYGNALNYRYIADGNPVQLPNWQSPKSDLETVTVPREQLTTGGNYLHLISVRAGATIGTLETAYPLTINTAAPTVASQSHPSSSQFYEVSDVQLQWTNPQPDQDVRAYYYVFDRYATTIPTKSDSKLPGSDKDLVIPNRPAGTIWYFHLLSEDTMGYLTKAAQHFRVNIGPTPPTGSLNGDIWEEGSSPKQPLDGVTITLNRGSQKTQSSNGGQYFFNDTLPAIANKYELRAEKDGYLPFVREVAVTAGQTLRVDIALKKAP